MQKIARKKRIISEPRGSDKVDFEEQMKLFYEAVQAKHDSSIDSDGKRFNLCIKTAVSASNKASRSNLFSDLGFHM